MSNIWDEKFANDEYLYGTEPNQFVKNESHRFAPDSKIVCLAEGEGRNGVYLAEHGHKVTCVDTSIEALKKAARLARDKNVTLHFSHTDIFEYSPNKRFDAAVCTFLHLPFDELKRFCVKLHSILDDGGLLVGQCFTKNQLNKSSGGPKDPNLLYDVATLGKVFKTAGFEILKLDEKDEELYEGDGHIGVASVVGIVAKKL
jgi:SAM-dependent methyltransferase